MIGGLNQGAPYERAAGSGGQYHVMDAAGPTDASSASSPATPPAPGGHEPALQIGRWSLTMHELLALAIMVDAAATAFSLYLEVRD